MKCIVYHAEAFGCEPVGSGGPLWAVWRRFGRERDMIRSMVQKDSFGKGYLGHSCVPSA